MITKITDWLAKLPKLTIPMIVIALFLNIFHLFRYIHFHSDIMSCIAVYGSPCLIVYSVSFFLGKVMPLFILSLLFAWILYLLLKQTMKMYKYWDHFAYIFLIMSLLSFLSNF